MLMPGVSSGFAGRGASEKPLSAKDRKNAITYFEKEGHECKWWSSAVYVGWATLRFDQSRRRLSNEL